MKKWLKIFLSVYCVMLILGTCDFFAMGNFIYSVALIRSPVSEESVYSQSATQSWLWHNSTQISIFSEEGLELVGYYADNPASQNKYVITCHGYTGDAFQMSYYADMFYQRGYSVLAPDARAHGKSDGNVRGMGYLERKDIMRWINYILSRDPFAEIVLFGVSIGGATVLFTSGEANLPPQVKAMISDCAFSDVYNEIGNVIRGYVFFLPSFPIVDSASVVCEIRGGYSFRDASCVESVKRSCTPTLFIHGSADTFVPIYMLDELYNSASCVKSKLIIEGAAHMQSSACNPDLYWTSVWNFIETV